MLHYLLIFDTKSAAIFNRKRRINVSKYVYTRTREILIIPYKIIGEGLRQYPKLVAKIVFSQEIFSPQFIYTKNYQTL